MKNYILLVISVLLACKTSQKETTIDRPEFEIIATADFDFMATGTTLDMGGITLTKLDGPKALVTRAVLVKESQVKGQRVKQVDRSRTEINIDSKNKDKSKTVDKSRGDLDKSKEITKVPSPALRYILYVFILLLAGILWFFSPKIKSWLKIFP